MINGRLEQVIASVFDGATECSPSDIGHAEYEKRQHEFIFHMTDWRKDLQELSNMFQNPDKYDEEVASALIIGFLYHVIPHINAAGRLLLGKVPDPFLPPKPEA